MMLDILVACEESQEVTEALLKRGHNAISCDLEYDGDKGYPHYKGDVREILHAHPWHMIIAFPPCTYLCNSGAYLMNHDKHRKFKMVRAANFFKLFLDHPCNFIAVENPIMHNKAKEIIGAWPSQSIQPYEFGHDASKTTCLWLKNLPNLQPTKYIAPRIVNGYNRWANQTPSGRNALGPTPDRAKLRSKTYTGIAEAMAEQWTEYIIKKQNNERTK